MAAGVALDIAQVVEVKRGHGRAANFGMVRGIGNSAIRASGLARVLFQVGRVQVAAHATPGSRQHYPELLARRERIVLDSVGDLIKNPYGAGIPAVKAIRVQRFFAPCDIVR
jgi:hypothetical protein